MHAHIRADLPRSEVSALEGIVFAATRSLEEAESAIDRNDERVIWGVGLHPGLVGVQKKFDISLFQNLVQRTPLVSEIGLDGTSRVPMELQLNNFHQILEALVDTPRITSVHSAGATGDVLNAISLHGATGIVLHWWLGSEKESALAVEMGCYFSLNASVGSINRVRRLPLERLLPETDHPFGDRRERASAQPGNVALVEKEIGAAYGMSIVETRLQLWRNLKDLVAATNTTSLLPRSARLQLATI